MSLLTKGAACWAALGFRTSRRTARPAPGNAAPDLPRADTPEAPAAPGNQYEHFLHQPAFSRQASVLGKQTAEIKVCCDDSLKAWVHNHASKFGMSSSEYIRNLLWRERNGFTYDEAIEQLERHNRELRLLAFSTPVSIEGGNGAPLPPVPPVPSAFRGDAA